MSEIEVGEYIRTNRGTIGKLNRIIEEKERVAEETLYELHLQKNEYYLVTFNEIAKHSFDIIDLIEVGDIVEYIDDDGEYIKDFIVKKHTPASLISLIEYLKAYCKVITILTHEQYENIKYEVE